MATSALSSYLRAAEQARSRTESRLAEAKALADRNIKLWEGPESEYMQGVQSALARERTKYLATGTQALAQSGLFNTSMRAGLGGRFAEEVAAPTLSQAQARQMELLSQALMQKAGILASVEDIGPDPALIASLTQASSRGGISGSLASRTSGPEWIGSSSPSSGFSQPSTTPSYTTSGSSGGGGGGTARTSSPYSTTGFSFYSGSGGFVAGAGQPAPSPIRSIPGGYEVGTPGQPGYGMVRLSQ